MNVYKRIETLCSERGIKLSKVAKDCKLSTHVLYDWRSGKTEPTLVAVEKVCEYFQISLSEFFSCRERTEDQNEFLEQIEELNENNKKFLKEVLIFLADKNNK